MVICLEQGANDLHMVQLMPLPPHHLLLQQNPEWFILLILAYPGCPGKRPSNDCVCIIWHDHFCTDMQIKTAHRYVHEHNTA